MITTSFLCSTKRFAFFDNHFRQLERAYWLAHQPLKQLLHHALGAAISVTSSLAFSISKHHPIHILDIGGSIEPYIL